MKNKTFGIKEYYKPTPKDMRILGDGMLLISGIATLFVPGLKWAVALGLVGKFITNSFGSK
jgi:hypothetical protein